MSFILDALKKSETERQQQGPSDFANVPSGGESPGAPRWLWALGLLLAVNLAVLLVVLLRDDTPSVQLLSTDFARRFLQIWVRGEDGSGDPQWAFGTC